MRGEDCATGVTSKSALDLDTCTVVGDRGALRRVWALFFFFSSRRRHTRLQGDWSSDVCSSDLELAGYACEQLAAKIPDIRLFGPKTGRAGVVSFLLKDVHAHDVVTVADQRGVALRGGHHCTQPLMRKLGIESTARARVYFYNTNAAVDRIVDVVREIQKLVA